MNTTHESHDLLRRRFNEHLQRTRLSLTQIAKKMGVSKGHLSEIKNGKSIPSLNLGLKILKICEANSDECRQWVEEYATKSSEEYDKLIYSSESLQKKTKLANSISQKLVRNFPLFNTYLDIIHSGSQGIGQESIIRKYGTSLIPELDFFAQQGVIRHENGFYYAQEEVTVLTKSSSYDFMRKFFEDEKANYESGYPTGQGKFEFIVDDVDEMGYKELNQLYREYMIKASEIFNKRRKHKSEGGKRYLFQSLLSRFQVFLLAFVIPTLLVSTAIAGGVNGGSSWYDVRNDQSLKPLFHQYNIRGYLVGVDKLCKTEKSFKTMSPYEICLKRNSNGENFWCENSVTKTLEIPRRVRKQRCRWANSENRVCYYEDHYSELPTVYNIDIFEMRGMEREYYDTRVFEIPDCGK